MNILNQHQRLLNVPRESLASLLNSLASAQDKLWPRHRWPEMKLNPQLRAGATGGHGPIQYFVEDYIPGSYILFRFTYPKGFDGFHRFDVIQKHDALILQHTLEINTKGFARISWPLIYRPLHDALIEDALATAQLNLQQQPEIISWSPWVKFLRWVLSRGRAKTQSIQSSNLQ